VADVTPRDGVPRRLGPAAGACRPAERQLVCGDDVHESYFGPPLRLAASARRLDLSPAWHSWVGTLPALQVVEEIGVAAINEHDVGLANRFRAGLGLEPGDSAIVSAPIAGGLERLERAGIVAAERGGSLRTSWHVYNTAEDVDRVLDVLAAP
jgi:selenocysteine lyase/cysteine desulfurase